jgi:hypothetical protein
MSPVTGDQPELTVIDDRCGDLLISISVMDFSLPPSMTYETPTGLSAVFVSKLTFEIAAIDESASPLNPRVLTVRISSAF